MRGQAIAIGLSALGALSAGCLRAAPASSTSPRWCGASQRLLAKATFASHVEVGIEASVERRREYPIHPGLSHPKAPAALSVLAVGPRVDQLILDEVLVLSTNSAVREDCGFIQRDGEVPAVDTIEPGKPGTVEFSRVRSDGSGLVATRFRSRTNPDGRGPRWGYLVERRTAEGRVDFIETRGATEAVLLASGVIVVRNDSRFGSTTLLEDGTLSPFGARIDEMVGWGNDRIWGVGPTGRSVIGADHTGDVFFRRRARGSVSAVMPYRDGVCAVTDDGDVRCFGLDGELGAEVQVSGGQTFAVEAEGRIYAASTSAVYAFKSDGTLRWRDELNGLISNLVLSPVHGLCLVDAQRSATLICYGTADTTARRANPGRRLSTNSIHASQSASVEALGSGTRQSK